MKNIKCQMATYRESVRHLWNFAFSSFEDNLRYGVCLDLFDEIEILLFKSLVCEPLGIKIDIKTMSEPINCLKIKPHSDTCIHAMINRTKPASGYWDYPVTSVAASDVDLVFMSFFDWEPYGQKDFRYYRARISNSKENIDLIGRDVLIETFSADVWME